MPPSADVGKTIVTYKIRFDAVIKAPDKPEAKEGKS
jgi:hypothetical protein